MRTAPAPGPRDSKTESAPQEEKNPQNTRNTQSADSEGSSPDSPNSPESPISPASPKKRTPALIFDDPLDQPSADDTDRGWGERPPAGGDSAADLARFLDEKPPHHL
ncbi:hypothetical protein [Streptomyces sp. NPDC000229]|uniref:hypothetical protein n=1 Tax=Streptomyces sp. NPDC000229 TaxID=3154247 RepID=UPI0033239576